MADHTFVWNDQPVQEAIEALHRAMTGLGGFLVTGMKTRSPKDTHDLENSISDSYDPATFTLTLTIGMGYGVYQEFGTRNMSPHPFIRPTIYDAAARYDWIDWDVLLNLNPPVLSPSHLRASTSGFRIPKSANLTPRQLKHVNEKLRPTSKSFAGKFKRRKIGFKVQGPDRRGF